MPITYLMYIFFAVVAVLAFFGAADFPASMSGHDIGPARLPQVLAVAMLILVIIDMIASRRQAATIPIRDFMLAVVVMGMMSAMIFFAQKVGLFAVLPFALFIGLVLSGAKNHIANVCYAIGVPAFVWFVFDRSLQIPLSSF